MRKDLRNGVLLYDYLYRDKSLYMNFYMDYNSYGKKAYVDFPLLSFRKAVDALKGTAFRL